jgi:hypothetical protein
MLETVLSSLNTYVVELMLTAILTYGGFLGRWLLRTKESREALHVALSTGLSLVSGKIFERVTGVESKVEVADLVEELVDYVELSVPDALKFLRPSRKHLEVMATSYIIPAIVKAKTEHIGLS